MTVYLGTATASAGLPGHEPKVEATLLSRGPTSFKMRYRVGSNSINSKFTSGLFSGTLKINGSSYVVSASVPASGGWWWSRDVTYNQSSAATLAISLTGSIPGTTGWTGTSLSGSFSVPAGVAKPVAVDDLILSSRASDTSNAIVMAWGAVSEATSYKMRYRRDSGAWGDATAGTISGTTYSVTPSVQDAVYEYNVRAVNAGGDSPASNYVVVYTAPVQTPTPTLSSDGGSKVSVPQGSNKYTYGLEIERSADGTAFANTKLFSGTGIDGSVLSITDTRTVAPLSKWRARRFLGAAGAPHRVYGPWSDWSDTIMSLTYETPQITKLTATRCDSGGTPTQTGKYLRVTSSGKVSSVKNASNTETNKITRKVAYRKKDSTGAWTETTLVNQGSPNNWTDVSVVIGANQIAEADVWDIRYTVFDSYTPSVTQFTMVSKSQVALALGVNNAGIGTMSDPSFGLTVAGDTKIIGNLHVDDPNVVVIGGVPYQRTGVVTIPTGGAFTAYGNIYTYVHTWTLPYAPPAGWTFKVTPRSSPSRIGMVFNNATTSGGTMQVRYLQISNGTWASSPTGFWELVKN